MDTSEKPKSLYRELRTALVVLVLLVSVAVNLFNYFYLAHEAELRYESKAADYTAHLRESLEWPLWNIDDELIRKIGNTFSSNPDVALLTIRDDRQRVIYHYEKSGTPRNSHQVSVSHNAQNIGSIELGLSLALYEKKDRELMLTGLIAMTLLVLALLAASRWILLTLLSKPINTVLAVTNDIVEGKYRQGMLPETHVEFAPILASLKAMSDAVASREESLRTSEEKFRKITESAQDAIIMMGADERISAWNPAAELLFGYTADEAVGQELHPLIAPRESQMAFKQGFATFLQTGTGPVIGKVNEIIAVRKSGEAFTVEGSLAALSIGGQWNAIGIFRDITERKRAEAALRTSKQLLDNIIENIPNMIFLKRASDLRFELFNRAGETLLGHSRDELIGRNDYDFFPKEQADSFTGKDRAVLEQRDVVDIAEELIETPHGTRILHTKKLTLCDEQNKPQYLLGISEDITEHKRAVEELIRYKDHLETEVQQRTSDLMLARDAAETANRAKSIFLSNMSHELRTPLNAILGFSTLLGKDPQLSQAQLDKLDIINRSGEHLLALINDVLEMAKIEAGRIQLETTPFDLGRMVRDVTDMMDIRAQAKGLRLLLDQSSHFPRYILGDEARIRQILINLVGNAIKFTEQGGVTLRLGTRQNSISHLMVEVEDSGPGIPAEDQQRLFQPFVQLGRQPDNKGTGLGLAITRQFVQLMNGSISVESTPGTGSVFKVDLPLNEVKEADIPKPKGTEKGDVEGLAPNQPEYRILIAEDQMENQLLLSNLMNSVGFAVKVAENGAQALKLFQSWQPHLIWMDRRMPVMDGLEATRRIRQLPGGRDVKIVAVTASAFSEQRDEMLAAGMNDFVRKPYRFNEIYECLGKQLGVQFIYAGTPAAETAADVPLTAQMLAILPPELRRELHDALESLEAERIGAVIEQATSHDPTLHKTLSHLAGNFDYPAILKALQESTTGTAS